jgi:predicted small integral membrane protein
MVWTLPTAGFFSAIALILAGMTVWQYVSPSVERKGFLPIVTTRGDRLFIGLLTSAFLHLGIIGFTEFHVLVATAMSVIWIAILMRWG